MEECSVKGMVGGSCNSVLKITSLEVINLDSVNCAMRS